MMKKKQPASLKIGKTARFFLDTFKYEVIRTKRKTLTLYVKQQRVIVRCPLATTYAEINEFISSDSGVRVLAVYKRVSNFLSSNKEILGAEKEVPEETATEEDGT